jgi:hypothetical protein
LLRDLDEAASKSHASGFGSRLKVPASNADIGRGYETYVRPT